MDLQLENKLAVVTGSTAGIGLAIARHLLDEGARVIINGRTQEAVSKIVEQLSVNTKGELIGFAGDISQAHVADQLFEKHPNVEILINNMSIYENMLFEDISDDEWRRFFEVNVLSGVRLSRLYLPTMRKKNWGRIIFISSESAVHIPAEMVHYGMTKTAQLSISRGIAESVAGTGITANSVLAGPTMTRGTETMMSALTEDGAPPSEELKNKLISVGRPTSLIKRWAQPNEVASMVAYLASPLASATTGAALRADGGVVKSVL